MTEEARTISQRQIKTIDRLYWDPSERATGILNLIVQMRKTMEEENKQHNRPPGQDVPSDWDLLCFCIEYMGQKALAIGDETFMNIAQLASRWLYSVHYSNPGAIYGAPDKQAAIKRQLNAEEKEDVSQS